MALPPGLSGYVQGQQLNNQNEDHQLRQTIGMVGILNQIRAQQQEQQLRGALASGDQGALMRTPGGMGVLAQMAQIQKLNADAQESQRQNDFYSQGNLAHYMTPGNPGSPSPADEYGGGPAEPSTAPKFDLNGFAQAGAMQGIKGSAALLNNLTQRQQAQATLAQTYQLAQQRLDAQVDAAKQRGEDQKTLMQMRLDGQQQMAHLAASLRPQPQEQLVPVKEADGRVTYLPRSQAVGREVGGRTTDVNLDKQVQQLGTSFEKAGLNQTIPTVNAASQITPELATYIAGPKALMPDLAIPDDAKFARQAVQKLFNITLKDRSGAAVTNQEMDRLKKEFGNGVFRTPQQLINAISQAKGIVEKHYQGIAASYGADALEKFNTNLESIGGTPFKPSGGGAKADPLGIR